MQLCQNMKNMNIIGPSSGEENDLNGLSSTSSELLPPDGTIHYSRQQDMNSQLASTHGQASKELTLGTDRQVPQSFDDHNIQVYKALSTSSECSLVL